jgi:hypothetical protein
MSLDDLEFRARTCATVTNRCFFVVTDTNTGQIFVTDSPTTRTQILRVAQPKAIWPIPV